MGDLAGSSLLMKGGQIRWPSFQTASTKDGNTFTFLGKTNEIGSGWAVSEKEKLWVYNLHYLHDAAIFDGSVQTALAKEIIESWVTNHIEKKGTAWEPYPISLRLVNILKFYSHYREVKPPESVLSSLAEQSAFLSQRLEYHILGNHLFVNGKALVFAGALLDSANSEAWLRKGLKILHKEVSEQFCEDGGHFELSPMYHASLLWDLCDLVMLAQKSESFALTEYIVHWQSVISKGIHWLQLMVHPDKEISFFNDASFGIAPTLEQLERYASELGGISHEQKRGSSHWVAHRLKSTGYIVVENTAEQHKSVLDVAEVGPSYQPGHAHADTLSFELSLFGQRIFVNSGTSQYGTGRERSFQRGSSAHNTVTVDGENSSEVWSGFRVAGRAIPYGVEVSQSEEKADIKASHNGYRRLKGKVDTSRVWRFETQSIVITDRLQGSFDTAISRLYCHPDIEVSVVDDFIKLTLKSGDILFLEFEGMRKIEVLDSYWHPRFGVSIPNSCIACEFEGDTLNTTIKWGGGCE